MNLNTEDQLDEPRIGTLTPDALIALLESVAPPVKRPPPAPLSFTEIGHGYPTQRSLLVSVLSHVLVLAALAYYGRLAFLHPVDISPNTSVTTALLQKPFYLPVLGGGSEGEGKKGGGSGSDADLSSGVRARSKRGFAYPGAQPLVSDPPQATLGIQTILQPELKNPTRLHTFIPLPNIARPAAVEVPEPPKQVLKVIAGEVRLKPSTDAPVAAPKITLPVATTSQPPTLDASQPIMPALLPTKPPVPSVAEIPTTSVPRDQKGLLVLNAIAPPADVPTKIPQAESRSLFAVTPQEATVIAEPGAGSKSGNTPSKATGVGTPADVASGDALADAPAGGSSRNAGGSGTGSGGKYGTSSGSGLSVSGDGTATGRGTSAAIGIGAGVGKTPGSGTGGGSAAGTGGFPGMTIAGGRYGNDGSGAHGGGVGASVESRRPSSYNMTITSTASSGGGLQDFGVFENQKVYTVYLDMRSSDEDTAPSWTLQYAVEQPSAADVASGNPSRIKGTPTPPYAMLKEIPELSHELAAKYGHRLIVISAIMNTTGKLEQISVKQTPDAQLNAAFTEALTNWNFQPSAIDGKAVALKVLFGIRLAGK
jgi:hypothetical protein